MKNKWKVLIGAAALVAMSGTAFADHDIGLGVSIAVPGVSAFFGEPARPVYVAPPQVVYQAPPAYYAAPPQAVYYEAQPQAAYYGTPGVSVYYGPSREDYRGDRRWHRHRWHERKDDDD